MYSALLALLVLPLLALAQTTPTPTPTNNANNNTQPANNGAGTATPAPTGNGTAAAAPQNTTVVFTSISTSIGLGPGRVETTSVITQLSTSVFPIPTAAPAGNSTTNGTATNGTTSSTSTTPLNLPTAPASVDGGGVGGAPSPGAGSSNGAFGPDDSYIAAASALAQKALAVSLVATLVGGALVVL